MNEREYEQMFLVEQDHWWYVALHRLIMMHVAEEADGRKLTILDAGCGTGRLCQLLSGHGHVRGCDVSEEALAFCRERGLEEVIKADLNLADLGESTYDVITAIDVLYHREIKDDAPVLASFHKALKPGGLLILNLVAHEFLRSTHDIAVHTRKRYCRSDTTLLLDRCGFQVETAVYRLGFLFFPILCYRLGKRLILGNKPPAEVASDVFMPPSFVNRMLLAAALKENAILKRGFGPLGTSLFVTARKLPV